MKTIFIFFFLMVSPLAGTDGTQKEKSSIFPKDLIYTKISDKEHQYVIKNVYISKSIEDTLEYCPEYQKDEILDCLEVKIYPKERTMTITTSKQIKDIEKLFTKLAKEGGVVPTWEELSLREKKSGKYVANLYKLIYSSDIDFDGTLFVLKFEKSEGKKLKFSCYSTSGDLQANYADYVVEFANGKFSLSQVGKTRRDKWPGHVYYDVSKLVSKLKYGKDKEGYLGFNETTAYCECHSRYAMRIFDGNKKYIWENQNDIFGNVFPAVFDFDGDGIDEIIIFREDHGNEKLLIFSHKQKLGMLFLPKFLISFPPEKADAFMDISIFFRYI